MTGRNQGEVRVRIHLEKGPPRLVRVMACLPDLLVRAHRRHPRRVQPVDLPAKYVGPPFSSVVRIPLVLRCSLNPEADDFACLRDIYRFFFHEQTVARREHLVGERTDVRNCRSREEAGCPRALLTSRPPAAGDGAFPLVRVREEQSGIDTSLLITTEADSPTDRFIFKAPECDHNVVLTLGLTN